MAHCAAALLIGIASTRAAHTNWTTSGLSSGAFFAVQMGVAFSSECLGIGVVAGGPYYCAEANEIVAVSACMTAPIEISVDKLEALTDDFATDGDIDDPANIAHQNVYLFSGRKDITVLSGVVADTAKYLQSFGANTHFDTSQNCAHGFVTNFYGAHFAFSDF